MYKGYKVKETVIHDYEHPATELVVLAPCGCYGCDDGWKSGHAYCSASPDALINDNQVQRRYDSSYGWFWVYLGPSENVDSFL